MANYNPSLVNGTLTVTAANLAIIPSINSSIEYNTDYATGLGYITLSGDPLVAVADAVEPTNAETGITYEYKVAGEDDATYSATAPTALGSYNVRVAASSVKGKGAYADLADIQCTPAQFSIVPRAITVVINNVTLAKGSTVETLNAHATVVDGWDAGVKEGETLEFNFMFDPTKVGADKTVVIDNENGGRISQGTGYAADNDAIIAELKAGDYNGNYAVTFTPGDLIFGASTLVLDPADADLATKITEAAATGEDYEITFASMPMNEKEWYAFVLPFNTTPADLVGKLKKYVVVNRFKSSTIDEAGKVEVKFGLEMDEIPAGEPFLIKAATDMDWNVITAGNVINVAAADFSGDIAEVGDAHATFTGTYKTTDIVQWGKELDGTTADADAKYRWLAHNGLPKIGGGTYADNNWKNPKTNPHTLAAMEAYLVLDKEASSARVFVEDFENGTTAVKSISVEDINGMTVKGLYNLNGMKMQGAPTQKGIYIQNGKKVVIK